MGGASAQRILKTQEWHRGQTACGDERGKKGVRCSQHLGKVAFAGNGEQDLQILRRSWGQDTWLWKRAKGSRKERISSARQGLKSPPFLPQHTDTHPPARTHTWFNKLGVSSDCL